MKTGLYKKPKATNIYFNETDRMIEVCTYNTALKAGRVCREISFRVSVY